jgi:hypothetical protein
MRKPRLTYKLVNAAIKAQVGAGIELVRGKGYHYFAGDNADAFDDSVYVFHLHQLTLEQWVAEAKKRFTK